MPSATAWRLRGGCRRTRRPTAGRRGRRWMSSSRPTRVGGRGGVLVRPNTTLDRSAVCARHKRCFKTEMLLLLRSCGDAHCCLHLICCSTSLAQRPRRSCCAFAGSTRKRCGRRGSCARRGSRRRRRRCTTRLARRRVRCSLGRWAHGTGRCLSVCRICLLDKRL